MSPPAFQKPVEDSVQRVNNEVAVGEDLAFQRKWWRFERIVWSLFLLIIVCDIAGLFGRGPLAHRRMENSALRVRYDGIQRYGTPSIVDVSFDSSALKEGKYRLFASQSMIEQLGNQRVIPSPESTAVGGGGYTYTFPATQGPAAVQFALQPAKPGVFHFVVQSPGTPPLDARVVVMP